jgi:uncharacterized MAPEG superfamily protein
MQSPVVTLCCVLVAALMPIVCAGIAKWGAFGQARGQGGFDNHDPRDWLSKQQGYRKRANAAQANCFEALPFFIGALLLALHMEAPLATVNGWALCFIGFRALYVFFYLTDQATLRTVAWVAGLAVNVALLFAGV